MQRSSTPAIFQANFALVIVIVLGLLIAVFLGTVIGESDIKPLLYILLACVGLAFAVGLYRYVWQIGLFLFYFGFNYRTIFSFGPTELSCAFGFALIAIFFWQKKNVRRPAILATREFDFVQKVLFVWLAYVAIHLIFNVKVPYLPGEFKLSNALKSYFGLSAPLFLLFYFTKFPSGLVVGKDFFWRIAQLLSVGLLINLAIRFYELAGGGVVYIPGINAVANGYALRSLGPSAMLLGAVGITGPRSERRTGTRSFVFWMLAWLGALSATLSGGRATIVYGFLCVCAVLFFRRKVVALALVVMLGTLGLAAANLSSHWINNRANPVIQRSLQWVLFQKNWAAVGDLESSTNWRRELFRRSIAEWQSDSRVFWTGRATFGFGAADETAILIAGGYEALIQTALRRGATHNLITDLLVAYGIIGLVLYFTVYFALIRFLWKLHRAPSLSPAALNLTLVLLVGSLFALLLDITSGGYFPPDSIWCILVLVAAFHNGVGISEERARRLSPPAPRRLEPVRLAAAERRFTRSVRPRVIRGRAP